MAGPGVLVDVDVRDDAPRSSPSPRSTPPAPAGDRRAFLRSPVVAGLVLLCIYVGLSFANDSRAFFGTDTGGKVATLQAMEARDDLHPDVGYWAEALDPKGVAHPLALTRHIGDQWVNVTTLPMVYAAAPLYDLAGYRGVLLLPMIGGVLCAFAARALARRAGARGDLAFWLVGLTTPVVVYSLDFWEHTLGLAAMLWAIVLALDVREGRAGWRGAAVAGALFGLAATMRTEALVYAAVAGGVVLWHRARSRRAGLVREAVAGVVGLAAPLVLNQLLEVAVLGEGLRAGRASSAASGGGTSGGRLDDALSTLVGVNHFRPLWTDWLFGAAIAVCVVMAGIRLLGRDRRRRVVGYGLLAVALVIYALRFADGLGFLPGLLVASPLAAFGVLATRRSPATRPMVTIALLALPLVWLFQYPGGALPQWGGRYVLLSGALLAIAAAVALERVAKAPRVACIGMAVVVSAAGVAWLSVRTHAFARTIDAVVSTREPVVTTELPHFLREAGGFYEPSRRWLTAESSSEVPVALHILETTGVDRFRLASRTRGAAPEHLGPYERTGRRTIDLVSGVTILVSEYRRP
jgi:hypothetical protein